MSGYNFDKPDAKSYSLGRGDAFLQLKGTTFMTHLGDMEGITLKADFQSIERYSKNFGRKTRTRKDIIQVGGTLEGTMLQRVPAIRQIIYQGLEKSVAQDAVAETTLTFEGVSAGGVVVLKKKAVTVSAVKIGNVALPSTAYNVDAKNGLVQVLQAGNVSVTFTAAAVDHKKIGGFSVDGLEGWFMFRGTNEIGDPELINVWNAEFALSSDVPLVGGDEYDQYQITATMYPDQSQEDPDDQFFTVEPAEPDFD